jgi:hypothetical protein
MTPTVSNTSQAFVIKVAIVIRYLSVLVDDNRIAIAERFGKGWKEGRVDTC